MQFVKEKYLYPVRSEGNMTKCSAMGLKSGYYNHVKVIDNTGKMLLIKNAEKVGTVGKFCGFSFSMGQRLRVKPNFGNKPTFS